MRVSILIPVYNEVARAPELLRRLVSVAMPGVEFEYIVVDDGSTDGTSDALAATGIIHERIRHSQNLGKGAALRTALSRATGEFVVVQDADLEYAPEELPALLASVVSGEVDVVFGNRMHAKNPVGYWRYYWGNRLISWTARLLYGKSIPDVETGAKVFRRSLLASLDVQANDFGFEAEVVGKVLAGNATLMHVPISYTPRSFAQGKKIGWRDGVQALWLLWRHRPKQLTRLEWRALIGLTVGLMLVTSAPLVYGWWRTPTGSVFTGVHFANLNDWFVYYSYFEQVRQGRWLFADLFASVPHVPTLYPVWLVIGWLGKLLGLGNIATLQLARLLLIPAYVAVAYALIREFFGRVSYRLGALGILTFGGGAGILLLDRVVRFPFNYHAGAFQWPMDLWVPEGFTFLTLYYSPHFIVALIFLLLVVWGTLRRCLGGGSGWTVLSAASAGFLLLFHPFHFLSMLGVVAALCFSTLVYERRLVARVVWHGVAVLVASFPAAWYYAMLLASDELIRQKTLQNLTFTPPLWITLWSYGLLLVGAVLGARTVMRRPVDLKSVLLIVWAAVQFAALYAPVSYQRRMSAGVQVPMALLATAGFGVVAAWLSAGKSRLARLGWRGLWVVVGAAGTLLVSSTLFVIGADLIMYTERRPYVDLSVEVVEAAKWLRAVPADSVIFHSARNIVSVLPAYAGRAVYVGHGVETPMFAQKQKEVEWFFSRNRSEEVERSFLQRRSITHLWYSTDERKLGAFDPTAKSYLREVFANAQVTIYEVL